MVPRACRCCDALVERSYRPGQPEEERRRKRIILPTAAAIGLYSAFSTVVGATNPASPQSSVCAHAMVAAALGGM
eukprot:gene56102-60110_t